MKLALAAAAIALGLATSASALTTVTIEAAGVQNTTMAITGGVETFDSAGGYSNPYLTSFGGSTTSGSFNGLLTYGADTYGGAGGTGRYVAVQTSTTLTLTGAATDYFGLWASSLDGANTVAFYKGGALVDTITLTNYAVGGDYYGNPTAAHLGENDSQEYVFFNFVVAGGYDEVRLIENGGGGFELDNITVGTTAAVPEPASWALMIGGFTMVGAAMRRRKIALA